MLRGTASGPSQQANEKGKDEDFTKKFFKTYA